MDGGYLLLQNFESFHYWGEGFQNPRKADFPTTGENKKLEEETLIPPSSSLAVSLQLPLRAEPNMEPPGKGEMKAAEPDSGIMKQPKGCVWR